MDASKWKKTCAPVLSSYCFEDRMGTGHNSFYRDEDGFPALSIPPDWDLPETLKTVNVEVILQELICAQIRNKGNNDDKKISTCTLDG